MMPIRQIRPKQMKRCLMAAFIKFTKHRGRGHRGKAGGRACAPPDEDRYCTVKSEEGSHCARIYEDLLLKETESHCNGRSLRKSRGRSETNVPGLRHSVTT